MKNLICSYNHTKLKTQAGSNMINSGTKNKSKDDQEWSKEPAWWRLHQNHVTPYPVRVNCGDDDETLSVCFFFLGHL